MSAEDFLQKHDIGRYRPHCLAQLRKDETPVERGEAFMCVHGQQAHRADGRGHMRVEVAAVEGVGLVQIHANAPSNWPGVVSRSLSSPSRRNSCRAS